MVSALPLETLGECKVTRKSAVFDFQNRLFMHTHKFESQNHLICNSLFGKAFLAIKTEDQEKSKPQNLCYKDRLEREQREVERALSQKTR